jgi:hypothetical protein
VAKPLATQSIKLIQTAKITNVNVEGRYKDLVTQVYQDAVRPALSTVSKAVSEAYTTVSTDGLEQAKARQEDALIKYNEWISQTYSQLVEAFEESGAGPILGDITSRLQGQLDEVAEQVTSNLPSFVQSRVEGGHIIDDFVYRVDVIIGFQAKMAPVDATSVIQVQPIVHSMANVAAQYQHLFIILPTICIF